MLEQEPRQPNARAERTRGWIVNAASILGKVAIAQSSAYTTSKHAVVGLTKQMAVDYAEDRIHVGEPRRMVEDSALTLFSGQCSLSWLCEVSNDQ